MLPRGLSAHDDSSSKLWLIRAGCASRRDDGILQPPFLRRHYPSTKVKVAPVNIKYVVDVCTFSHPSLKEKAYVCTTFSHLSLKEKAYVCNHK